MSRPAQILVTVTTLVSLCGPASAQWTKVGLPQGGWVARVAAAGTTLLASKYDGGVFRSSDGGATWMRGTADEVLTMLAFVGDRVYAGDQAGGLYRSDDMGATWTKIFRLPASPHAAASLGARVCVGTDMGIHTSTDGTAWTWAPMADSRLRQAPVNAIIVSGGVLYAGLSGGGVLASRDSGVTWSERTRGLSNLWVHDLVATDAGLFAATAAGVFRSVDGGDHWSAARTGLTVPDIAAIASSGSALVAATARGVFRSTDAGATWAAASAPPPNLEVFNLTVQGAAVFASTGDGVWASNDGGNTWTDRKQGMPRDWLSVTALMVTGSKLVAAAGELFLTADDGASWTGGTGWPLNKTVQAFAATAASLFAGGDNGFGVYRSGDGGLTWRTASTGLAPSSNVAAFAVSNHTLFAAMNQGVFRSTDDGANWTPAWVDANPSAHKPVLGLFTNGATLLAGSMVDGIGRSTDNGATWTATREGPLRNAYVRDFVMSGATIIAATSHGVLASTDGGATWAARDTSLTGGDVQRVAAASRFVVAAGHRGVFLSSDAGASWSDISAGLPTRDVLALAVRGSTLYATVPHAWIWRYQLPN